MSWLWRSGGQPKGVSRSSVEESHEQLDVTDRGRRNLPVHLGEMEAKDDRKGASRQSWQQGDAGGSLSSYLVKATSPKSKGKTKATTISSVEPVDKDVKEEGENSWWRPHRHLPRYLLFNAIKYTSRSNERKLIQRGQQLASRRR